MKTYSTLYLANASRTGSRSIMRHLDSIGIAPLFTTGDKRKAQHWGPDALAAAKQFKLKREEQAIAKLKALAPARAAVPAPAPAALPPQAPAPLIGADPLAQILAVLQRIEIQLSAHRPEPRSILGSIQAGPARDLKPWESKYTVVNGHPYAVQETLAAAAQAEAPKWPELTDISNGHLPPELIFAASGVTDD